MNFSQQILQNCKENEFNKLVVFFENNEKKIMRFGSLNDNIFKKYFFSIIFSFFLIIGIIIFIRKKGESIEIIKKKNYLNYKKLIKILINQIKILNLYNIILN